MQTHGRIVIEFPIHYNINSATLTGGPTGSYSKYGNIIIITPSAETVTSYSFTINPITNPSVYDSANDKIYMYNCYDTYYSN